MAQNDKDFASFLLGVFIINLLLYTSFYILMKLRYFILLRKGTRLLFFNNIKYTSYSTVFWFSLDIL